MKALTLTQPWATLVAIGEKTYDTRSWTTSYRGLLAIHAAKGWPQWAQQICMEEPFYSVLKSAGCFIPHPDHPNLEVLALPRGAIVAVASLDKCVKITNGWAPRIPDCPYEVMFGDYSWGQFAWDLHAVVALQERIPCTGHQGLWDVPGKIAQQIYKQTGRR